MKITSDVRDILDHYYFNPDTRLFKKVDFFPERKEENVLAEEISESEICGLFEGAKEKITINKYERNPEARQICIKHFGPKCYVCGYDFGKEWGKLLEGKIHVHHLIPLSKIGSEYRIDPIHDLLPVCPNCHLVIHSKKDEPYVYTIDEVKKMLIKNKK